MHVMPDSKHTVHVSICHHSYITTAQEEMGPVKVNDHLRVLSLVEAEKGLDLLSSQSYLAALSTGMEEFFAFGNCMT